MIKLSLQEKEAFKQQRKGRFKGCVSNSFATLILIAFVALLPAVIWIFNTLEVALSPQTYKQILEGHSFYEELVPRVLPALLKEAQQNGLEEEGIEEREAIEFLQAMFGDLSPDELYAMGNELMPENWLQVQMESFIDELEIWFENDAVLPDIRINMRPLKERLASDKGRTAINTVITSWDACAEEEFEQLIQFVEGDTEEIFPFCQPPASYIATMSSNIAASVERLVATIPDEIMPFNPAIYVEDSDIAEFYELARGFYDLKVALIVSRQMLLLFWLVPAALMALIVTISVRSAQRFSLWMGTGLVVGGLFSFIPITLIPLLLLDRLLTDKVGPEMMGEGGMLMINMGNSLIDALLDSIMQPVIVQTFGCIMVGVGFGVLWAILRSRNAKKQQTFNPVQTATGTLNGG